MSLLKANGLTLKYGNFTALKDITIGLDAGKIVGLLGPNGSGKTTLMKIWAGVLMNYSGTALLDGQAPNAHTKSFVSYLPDKSYLRGNQTPEEIFQNFEDWYPDFDLEKANSMLETFKIGSQAMLITMSKGMLEKVQIALVMARRARIYLLDEPLSGVDPASRSMILESIIKNYSEDALMVLSTHMVTESESIMDEVIFLSEGRIVLHGAADALREEKNKSLNEIFKEVY